MVLADMGADVLKVEDPENGDYMRKAGDILKDESAGFLMMNRGKRSMKLNLKHPEGRDIFLRLARNYDVILESFRPAVKDRLGVGYDQVKEVNPGIIYCSISGYGQTGPYRDKAGHDPNYLGIAGVLEAMGSRMMPVQIGDFTSALWAVIVILMALYDRKTTGEGRFLDVSIVDTSMPLISMIAAGFLNIPGSPDTFGDIASGSPSMNIYDTADNRKVVLGASEAKFWRAFCEGISRPDLIKRQNAPEPEKAQIVAEIRDIIKTKTRDEWIRRFEGVDACFTPINNLKEAFDNPQVKSRNLILDIEHPVEGKISTLAFPVRLGETDSGRRKPPPRFGEHTREVLTEIEISSDRIDELKRLNVI
jgi:crotonobetainyl-CoA:carnitine CoA-transferase CaiB-like acyl-CoA transferase